MDEIKYHPLINDGSSPDMVPMFFTTDESAISTKFNLTEFVSHYYRFCSKDAVSNEQLAQLRTQPYPVINPRAQEAMLAQIEQARMSCDSVGGIIECAVTGVPTGLGSPMLSPAEGRISSMLFSVPAVKGVEFGAGFAAAAMRGSENNDAFCMENGEIRTATNNCGGILGGITNGMPIVFRAAFKPTPSIRREQRSVSLSRMEECTLSVPGRHDPCIVPRAVPCVEAAAAIAVYDALLESRKNQNIARD